MMIKKLMIRTMIMLSIAAADDGTIAVVPLLPSTMIMILIILLLLLLFCTGATATAADDT